MPLPTIQQCTDITEEQSRKYQKMLIDKDIENPFYCTQRSCGELIGSFNAWQLSRGRVRNKGILCPHCKGYTCVKCREPKHVGSCVPDTAFAELLRSCDVRRCPKCGEAIEKNGGCPHMVCRTCGSHWWWTSDGQMSPY